MTAVQDTNLNLSFSSEGEESVIGLLKMQHNNGNVSLAFYPEIPADSASGRKARIAQIPDHVYQLSDFTMIEMNPDNRIQVKLSGSRAKCTLNFTNDRDTTKLFEYIEQKVHLKHSECNPCIFLLESLDSSSESVSPFMATALPKKSDVQLKMPTSLSLNTLQKPGLTFSTTTTPKHIKKDEFNSLFNPDGTVIDNNTFPSHFYNCTLDPEIAGTLWKLLLLEHDHKSWATLTSKERAEQDLENLRIYKIVKKQWRSVTKKQWENFPDLQNIVECLENDLEKFTNELFSKFKHPHLVQKMAFNILLTVTYYNWDGAYYTNGMIRFLMPFLESFVDDVTEKKVIRAGGAEADNDEVEADIFWCFYQFYISNKLSVLRPTKETSSLKTLFMSAGGLLESLFPELLQLLYMKHAYSLDFLRNDCATWFTECFEDKEIRRLWLSVLAAGGWFTFFQCFVVALLFSMSEELVKMNPLNSSEFVRRFNEKKKSIKIDLLLENTKGAMNLVPHSSTSSTPSS